MRLQAKRLLLTGITGKLGAPMASRLLEAGASVRALVRRPDQMDDVRRLGVEPILGALEDAERLGAAVADVDLVVHSAAYLGHDGERARSANVDGVRALARAALRAGVERFVHLSTLSVYGDPAEGVIDESYPLMREAAEKTSYRSTKADGERALASVAADGLRTVVLRVGAVSGERGAYFGDQLVESIAAGRGPVSLVHPDDLLPWTHERNFVEMVVAAASVPSMVGRAFNALDDNVSTFEAVTTIAWTLGRPVVVPDREAQRPIYACDAIRRVGYEPTLTFSDNVEALVRLARLMR